MSASLSIHGVLSFVLVTYIDVQMQQGCGDCGLFAIAFATSLARGEQPGSFFDEQIVMRKYLIESLEKQNVTAFWFNRELVGPPDAQS